MRSFAAAILLSAVLALNVQARAQGSASVVGSTVSGHVRCADTGAPARFGKVFLKSTTPGNAGSDFLQQLERQMEKAAAKEGKPVKPRTDEQKRQQAAAVRNMNEATDLLNVATVGLDGAYTFAGVKPGTYFVHALFPGYIDEYAQLTEADFASSDPAVRARIAALPTVTVNGTDAARADLRLMHGAALSGRVLYDDGTPAVGWTVWALRPSAAAGNIEDVTNPSIQRQVAIERGDPVVIADDRGNFRIAGLPGGSYVLRASEFAAPIGVGIGNLGQAGSGIRLTVYDSGTFALSEAKPISVTQGEERVGADVTVPARSLHALAGRVVAAADDHPLNKGEVSLTSKADSALHLKAPVRDDGSFRFDYLPGNATYTLSVANAADATYKANDASFMGISVAAAIRQAGL